MHESDVERCADLANQIVLQRRQKYLKKKGRKSSARSLRQYFHGPFKNDIAAVLLEAGKRAKEIVGITGSMVVASSDERASVFKWMVHLLGKDLRLECRGRGRPRKGKGLIASVMRKPVKRIGRPRTIEPDAEERWIHRAWGVATHLWADREEFPLSASIDEVINQLTQQPEWQCELENLFSQAIRHSVMQQTNPPAKNKKALSERARLARNIYPLPSKLKSGG